MRALVAAQGGEWREAVAEKPHPILRRFRKCLLWLNFLCLDETVLSHRRQNLVDDGASLGVDSRSPRSRSDCRSASADDLLSANQHASTSQDPNLPRAPPVRRGCFARANIGDDTLKWRDEPPSPASERCNILCSAGPNAGRRTTDDVARANCRRS